jgi:hypothetical protein
MRARTYLTRLVMQCSTLTCTVFVAYHALGLFSVDQDRQMFDQLTYSLGG